MQPNRCVPYSLPKSVEKSIIEFMTKIQIECGSLDIIYSSQEKYVFLEVNPIGKFQWLSKNCNYDIEKQIAIHLLKNCSL
jgi:glutathione synthase/RimK-type ligase-like ATP-grasp enzyme